MNPLTHPRRSLALVIAAALAVPWARAQDGQAVDIGQMLQQLRALRAALTPHFVGQVFHLPGTNESGRLKTCPTARRGFRDGF